MPVSSGCFLHYPFLARRDKPINVSLSRSGKSCFGARGVCVGGGGGAGYVKIVVTGMCGPNLASALGRGVCVCGGEAGYVKIVMTGMCGPNFSYKLT